MARKLPPLNALRAFEAAARHGSFIRAAEELNVSHAAISRHIRELEATLAVDLFRRLHRGVRLTPAGERFCAVLTDAFDRIAAATLELKGDTGAVVVSVEPAFAARWLVPRLGSLRAAHGDIDLVIDPSQRLTDFRMDGVDLGVRHGKGEWSGVRAEHLIDLHNFPVCAPSLAAALKKPADLRRAVLLHEESRKGWADWLRIAGVRLAANRGTLFHDASLAIDAAIAGQGVALGDNLLTAADLAAGRLVRPFAQTCPWGAYWLVSAEGVPERPAVATFRAWIKAEMRSFALRMG